MKLMHGRAAVPLRWKPLGPVYRALSCLALGILLGLAPLFFAYQYRTRNDPWKFDPPAYALRDHDGKPRIFTTQSPAELSKSFRGLSHHELIKWMRSRPSKWIAIGGKVDRVEVLPE